MYWQHSSKVYIAVPGVSYCEQLAKQLVAQQVIRQVLDILTTMNSGESSCRHLKYYKSNLGEPDFVPQNLSPVVSVSQVLLTGLDPFKSIHIHFAKLSCHHRPSLPIFSQSFFILLYHRYCHSSMLFLPAFNQVFCSPTYFFLFSAHIPDCPTLHQVSVTAPVAVFAHF